MLSNETENFLIALWEKENHIRVGHHAEDEAKIAAEAEKINKLVGRFCSYRPNFIHLLNTTKELDKVKKESRDNKYEAHNLLYVLEKTILIGGNDYIVKVSQFYAIESSAKYLNVSIDPMYHSAFRDFAKTITPKVLKTYKGKIDDYLYKYMSTMKRRWVK